MANEEHLSILEQGVETWNKWRQENKSVEIDLSSAKLMGCWLAEVNFEHIDLFRAQLADANLYHAKLNSSHLYTAHLSGAFLSKADLSRAELQDANLSRSDLQEANLSFANLNKANLNDANLTLANLQGASLVGAQLDGTILTSANLTNADFQNAVLGGTIFAKCDLSHTLGIQDVNHTFPSVIDIDTFHRSSSKIPLSFLRGCGLTDLDIEYVRLANPGLDPDEVTDIAYKIHDIYVKGGIQYYSCFISYSNNDEEFARYLHDDLQNSGVRCWFARENMKIGDRIRPRIDQEIRLCDKLLVILSENAIKSEWVGDEVEAALEEENTSCRTILLPIRLDDTVMKIRDGWAAKIKRTRHIGDFSNWKDRARYQKAFDTLLKDLKAIGA
jgi:uncharacterized protein YjbI with pentapeptide repeats